MHALCSFWAAGNPAGGPDAGATPVTGRPQRLRVKAHAATARASALVFGDDGPLLSSPPVRAAGSGGAGLALCGPEPACAQTAAAAGWAVEVSASLRGPDTGSWTGLGLGDIAAADPVGLAAWLGDPDARPHGGETLTELVLRLGDLLQHGVEADDNGSGAGRRLWVAPPLVVRALVVAALGAPAAVIFAVDVGFGGEVLLSGSGRSWRLQGLSQRERRP